MIVAAIHISMYGIACTNDGSHKRKRPDVIFCDQISACIPFLKEVPILSWLLPYSPKVIYFNIFKLRILDGYIPQVVMHIGAYIFSSLCLEDRILLPLSGPTTN